MKKLLQIVFALVVTMQITNAQDWTWIHGSDQINAGPSYGTQGVALPTNTPGGRTLAVTWSDSLGNLWLFGGEGLDGTGAGRLNDLWKYSVATNEWTWVKGDNVINQTSVYGSLNVSNPLNKPGGRHSAKGWIDANGNLWLFGGYGYASTSVLGLLNDLWKYNPLTNEWTFMGGDTVINQYGKYGTQTVATATNKPGSRIPSNAWCDSNGNFWMFGGEGYHTSGGSYPLSDLWKYNVTINQWIWMKGDSIGFLNSSFGTLGTPSASNRPGARYAAGGWIDQSDNLWLFSGHGYVGPNPGELNDLWKYNVATNQWVWMGGDSILNQMGIYGIKGISNSNNQPGGREETTSWTDKNGNFWLLGGHGYAASGSPFYLNDFWKFNTTTLEWTWMEGDSVTAEFGIYGTKGVASPLNKPGSRRYGGAWLTPNNDIWLMGGMGRGAVSSYGYLNDLWRYDLSYLGNENISNSENMFLLYPNPTNHIVCLYSKQVEPGMVANVYNNMGQLLLSAGITTERTTISTENMSSGIYLVHIIMAGCSVQQLTLVKQ